MLYIIYIILCYVRLNKCLTPIKDFSYLTLIKVLFNFLELCSHFITIFSNTMALLQPVFLYHYLFLWGTVMHAPINKLHCPEAR